MKKMWTVIIIVYLVSLLSSCSHGISDSVIQTAIAQTQMVSQNNTEDPIMTETPVFTPDIEETPLNPFSDIKVIVLGKNIINQTYSEFIELPFKVTNNTNKNIKGIEGVMHIKDMFGKTFLDINWDITQKSIPAKKTLYFSGIGLDYNQFMNDHQKLYSTRFENLTFEYEFKTVLFSDGTSITN